MREAWASNVQEASQVLELRSGCVSTTDRFVVFLDIMGFKDRVARNAHNKVLRQLEAFQNLISGYVSEVQSSNIQVALFSDSVLLFSEDVCKKSLNDIANVTCKIMLSSLQQDVPIPLKGAIAKGKVTCDVVKQLYFGQALIDAYTLEESIKYYGVLVHHSAENDVRRFAGKCFRDASAYLRSGRVAHYELNWYEASASKVKAKSVEDCLKDLRLTVSDEPRKYIDNTLSMYLENRTKESNGD